MVETVFQRLGMTAELTGVYAGGWREAHGEPLVSWNPATGLALGQVATATREDYERVVEQARDAFVRWRAMPPPYRGDVVRRLGNALRRHQDDLGLLVTLEVGKIRSEGVGEVREMIDMCDFSTGLSRQLHGLTIASERPLHRMFEQWHPLGPVGVITAFNFPVAVWAWNATLAAVCGDPVIWKPSPLAPLTAVAVQHIIDRELRDEQLHGVFNLCLGADAEVGRWMAADRRLPLISATGSCRMGRSVAETVGGRLGRTLLELGGNNGILVTETADLDLALRAVLFAAVGTSGQRCTTLRRLLLHESIADSFLERLIAAYASIPIGNPWEEGVLMGPLISESAVQEMLRAVDATRQQGGQILYGGQRMPGPGNFVQPTVTRAKPEMPIVAQETFAPLLHVMTFRDLPQAIDAHNQVDQGLSSAIFSDSLREVEQFLSPWGSDCGIANVNIGTSGAEIGGAFGGEKDTGGGREAGSDAWKAYMRRQTCTVNHGTTLPLAQGVRFDLP